MWEASPRPGDLLHWPSVYFPPLNLGPGRKGRGGYPRSWLQACPPLQGPDEYPLTLEASSPQHRLPDLLQEWAVLPWLVPECWQVSRELFSVVSSARGSEDPPSGHRVPGQLSFVQMLSSSLFPRISPFGAHSFWKAC